RFGTLAVGRSAFGVKAKKESPLSLPFNKLTRARKNKMRRLLFYELYTRLYFHLIADNHGTRFGHCAPGKAEFFTADFAGYFKAGLKITIWIHHRTTKFHLEGNGLCHIANR